MDFFSGITRNSERKNVKRTLKPLLLGKQKNVDKMQILVSSMWGDKFYKIH